MFTVDFNHEMKSIKRYYLDEELVFFKLNLPNVGSNSFDF